MKIKHLLFIPLIYFLACRPSSQKLPEAMEGFPTDTTIVAITKLPSPVNESSGIVKWNNHIWTHNDSSNEPHLYEVESTTGKLKRTVQIPHVKNTDWEDIAQDEHFFYIGDFGNNRGNRKDLNILKIEKKGIIENAKSLRVDTIAFYYPDQHDFSGPVHGHNFDCEAIISVGDSLYLFTKNFADQRTRLYSLPKHAGQYAAHLRDSFDVKGTITGAAISEAADEVALCGYYYQKGTFFPFIWLLWDYPNQSFFQGKQQRVNLDFKAQVEGICSVAKGEFIFSSESSSYERGQLFRFDAQPWLK